MTDFVPVFGIEVECEVAHHVGIRKGGYHCGNRVNEDWKAEDDGSLRASPGYMEVEFVSRVFKRNELSKVLRSLKRAVRDTRSDMRNLKINRSCGAHIHFSLLDTRTNRYNQLLKRLPMRVLNKIKTRAIAAIEKELPNVAPFFKSHYNRNHARTIQHIDEAMHGAEWDFTHNKGVEWRSFNTLGITNWKDLLKMYKIGTRVIEQELKYEMGKKKPMGDSATIVLDVPRGKRKARLKLQVPVYKYREATTMREISI